MTCRTVEKHLSEWVDGELDEASRRRVEGHLAVCRRCRARAGALEQAVRSLQKLPEIQAPPDFSERLAARLDSRGQKSRTLWRRLFRSLFIPLRIKLPLELAAAAAAGIVVLMVVLPSVHQDPGMKLENALESPQPRTQAVRQKPAAPPAPAAVRTGGAEDGRAAVIELAWAPAQGAAEPRAAAPKKGAGKGESRALFSARTRRDAADGEKIREAPAREAREDREARVPAVRRILAALEDSGGQIVALERSASGEPASVHLDLPSEAYGRFIDELSGSGRFQEKPPRPPSAQTGLFRVVVRIPSAR